MINPYMSNLNNDISLHEQTTTLTNHNMSNHNNNKCLQWTNHNRERECVCVCVRACVRACVRVRVRVAHHYRNEFHFCGFYCCVNSGESLSVKLFLQPIKLHKIGIMMKSWNYSLIKNEQVLSIYWWAGPHEKFHRAYIVGFTYSFFFFFFFYHEFVFAAKSFLWR